MLGNEREEFEPGRCDLLLSPDGKSVAYSAYRGEDKAFLVVGEKLGEEYEEVGFPVFSRVGRVLAFAAKKGGKGFTVVAGKKGKEFEVFRSPEFLPNGKALAYAAEMSRKWLVVVGDKKGEAFDDVLRPSVFSPDGSKVAFGARKGRELGWRVMVLERSREDQ